MRRLERTDVGIATKAGCIGQTCKCATSSASLKYLKYCK